MPAARKKGVWIDLKDERFDQIDYFVNRRCIDPFPSLGDHKDVFDFESEDSRHAPSRLTRKHGVSRFRALVAQQPLDSKRSVD